MISIAVYVRIWSPFIDLRPHPHPPVHAPQLLSCQYTCVQASADSITLTIITSVKVWKQSSLLDFYHYSLLLWLVSYHHSLLLLVTSYVPSSYRNTKYCYIGRRTPLSSVYIGRIPIPPDKKKRPGDVTFYVRGDAIRWKIKLTSARTQFG